MPRNLRVVPHDPAWPSAYGCEAARLAALFGDLALAIEHVGSTSVPGLCAKPIIDILIVVRDITRVDGLNAALGEAGYEAQGEFGIAGRRFFYKAGGDDRTHQVHAFESGHAEIQAVRDFRDYLAAHPDQAAAYAELKDALAARYPHDIAAYNAGKDSWVKGAIARARVWRAGS